MGIAHGDRPGSCASNVETAYAGTGTRPVVLVWLALSLLTQFPYALAQFLPPRDMAFVGTFHWIDDFYNYVSFVQQAEDGHVLFRIKLHPEEHPRQLVNLEWLLVGRVSAILGRRPFVAYRLLALAASLALLAGIDRWLRRAGLPPWHRVPALVLVATGGGLGGLLFEWTELPVSRCLDLAGGLYPFIGMLANPHWILSTALLVWSFLAYEQAQGMLGLARATTLGTILGLVRPYDLGLLVAARPLAVVLAYPPREWVRRCLPLAGLVPVVLYDLWVFTRPALAIFAQHAVNPPFMDLLPALGPAVVLAALTFLGAPANTSAKSLRLHFMAWALVAGLFALVRPVAYWSQFLVGAGLPLLALGALGLARFRAGATVLAAIGLCSTAVVALRIAVSSDPHWHVPAERLHVAYTLRATCRAGDLAFAPPDIGLYVLGLTACDSYLAHEAARDYGPRLAEARTFYSTAPPTWRSLVLDRHCVTHLLLPGDAGDIPVVWLGQMTPFRRAAQIGSRASAIGVYVRADRVGCGPKAGGL